MPQGHTIVHYIAYHSRFFSGWPSTYLFRVVFYCSLLHELHSSQMGPLLCSIFVPLTELFFPRPVFSAPKHVSGYSHYSWNQFALYGNNDLPRGSHYHFICSSCMAFIVSLLGIIVHMPWFITSTRVKSLYTESVKSSFLYPQAFSTRGNVVGLEC